MSKGNFEKAIENYNKALLCDNKHKDANKNLLSALTFYKSNNNNPIVIINNDLKKLGNETSIDNLFKKEKLRKLFKKSKASLSKIDNKFNLLKMKKHKLIEEIDKS